MLLVIVTDRDNHVWHVS